MRWHPVLGFESVYSVSDSGLVRRDCSASGTQIGRILRPAKSGDGYLTVRLWKSGLSKTRKIHRLVLEAFLGASMLQANHRNGRKHDNRLRNLEYVTAGENVRHSIDVLGNRPSIVGAGETNPQAKLTSENVREMRALRSNYSLADLADRFGVSESAVSRICSRLSWRHLDVN